MKGGYLDINEAEDIKTDDWPSCGIMRGKVKGMIHGVGCGINEGGSGA